MVFLNLVKTLTPNSDYTDLKHSLTIMPFFNFLFTFGLCP